MNKIFNLSLSIMLITFASCGNNKLSDDEESVLDTHLIEAYYVEPYEVSAASIQEVKNYMGKVAPEMYEHQLSQNLNKDYINCSLVYSFAPDTETVIDSKYLGWYQYNFTGKEMSNMELESVLCVLPTFKMCYEGLSMNHKIRETISENEYKTIIFNLRNGVGQVFLTENAEQYGKTVGLFCVQLGN